MLTLREVIPGGLTDDQYNQFDSEKSMQLLAYYKNGDLHGLIEKKVAGVVLVYKHLAKIFNCRELLDQSCPSSTIRSKFVGREHVLEYG